MSEEVNSETTFGDILENSQLLEAVSTLGFTQPTLVQALTIPVANTGADLVVQAKTGSGKTLAYGLPLLIRLLDAGLKAQARRTFGLVLAPTRELAIQLSEVLSGLVSDIAPTLLIGGMPYPKQKRQLESDPRIVIGTPGRVLDFLNRGTLDLRDCEFFVLDEADEMFSMGFYEDVQDILRDIPVEAQGLFVSATISPRVVMLSQKFLRDPKQIETAEHNESPVQVEHLYCQVGAEATDKPRALCDLLEHRAPESAIIFCNTRSETELVEAFLRRRGFDARRLNSDLDQRQRNHIMNKIRAKELRFLVATDVAARGIDLEQIELVANFSVHDQAESYVHRTGRTGRAGRSGTAISLVGPHDVVAFAALRKSLDVEFAQLPLPSEEELAAARLATVKQQLADAKGDFNSTELVLAERVLEHLGGVSNADRKLQQLIAGLTRFMLQHLVDREAVSLEEELTKENKGNSAKTKPNRGGKSSKRSQRDAHKSRGRRPRSGR